MTEIPPDAWLRELDELLERMDTDGARDDEVVARMGALDPDLVAFLVSRFAEQDTPQAATALDALANHAETPEAAREQACTALAAMAERGVIPEEPGVERFIAGWTQQGRERGEQILMLCWRRAAGDFEAFVFLLDWRGDGLKDFYRTRGMSHEEWLALIEHNRGKVVPLVEVDLAQAHALLRAALGESRRFSRSLPRDYKLEASLTDRRIFQASEPVASLPSYVSPELSAEEVVAAYIAALHYRDYLLAALLLDATHPLRVGRAVAETAEELRLHHKHAPRPEREAHVTTLSGDGQRDGDEMNVIERTDGAAVVVEAVGTLVTVERTGRKARETVRERYRLKRDGAWRVVSVS
ncbi:MAG: hypothetical protein ACRDHE_12595 [Ktedonobacterales bacterium]